MIYSVNNVFKLNNHKKKIVLNISAESVRAQLIGDYIYNTFTYTCCVNEYLNCSTDGVYCIVFPFCYVIWRVQGLILNKRPFILNKKNSVMFC